MSSSHAKFVSEAIQSQGLCGAIILDGGHVCIRERGHEPCQECPALPPMKNKTDGNQATTEVSVSTSASAAQDSSSSTGTGAPSVEEARFRHLEEIEGLLVDARREFSHKFNDAMRSTDALIAAVTAQKDEQIATLQQRVLEEKATVTHAIAEYHQTVAQKDEQIAQLKQLNLDHANRAADEFARAEAAEAQITRLEQRLSEGREQETTPLRATLQPQLRAGEADQRDDHRCNSWQPIETAPADKWLLCGYSGHQDTMNGRHILRHRGDFSFYDEYGEDYKRPHGWMLLPEAPNSSSSPGDVAP